MKRKSLIYFTIAILLVVGGLLLAVIGKDAVSKAESIFLITSVSIQKLVNFQSLIGKNAVWQIDTC